MRVLTAMNPDQGLNIALDQVLTFGLAGESRNGPVLRFPTPVTTVWATPLNRVSYSEVRDANPFLHLMEAMWMLAGRNDVETMGFYAKQMLAYSDDGVALNAAYGFRWRHHFGRDQLDEAVEILKKDPASRQVVVQIWDSEDLTKATKDKACLAGDTVLRSPEGPKTVKQLAKEFASGKLKKYPIYATDFSKDGWPVQLHYCTDVWSAGKKQTFKITFDDGSSVRATEDHKFFVKKFLHEGRRRVGVKSTETQVKDLAVGDLLCSGYFREDSEGYIRRKKTIQGNTSFANIVHEHRDYYSFVSGKVLPDDYVVHHENEQPADNRKDNLVLEATADHNSHHQKINNRHTAMTKRQVVARGKKHSNSLSARKPRIIEEFGVPTWDALMNQQLSRDLSPTDCRLISAFYKAEEKRKTAEAKQRAIDGLNKKKQSLSEIASRPKSKPVMMKIVSIEPAGKEEVFDFTVPKYHNAMLWNGVVTHNCNTQAMFDIVEGKLNMTITNRSNDIIWGCYGANVVHFSFLLEYMANRLGVPVGTYYQVSNNLHLYTEFDITKRFVEPHEQTNATGRNPYSIVDNSLAYPDLYAGGVRPMSLGAGIPGFEDELQEIVNDYRDTERHVREIPFFNEVVEPMRSAYACWKEGRKVVAEAIIARAKGAYRDKHGHDNDWLTAMHRWIGRRIYKEQQA